MAPRNESGLLIARVLVGLVFVAFAYYKLTNMGVWLAEVERLEVFAPKVSGWTVAVVELLGGLMLILGVKSRVAACTLAVFMTLATLMHVRDYVKTEDAFQVTNILKNLGILGGLTALWAAPNRSANLVP